MESLGRPGCIQVSPTTANLLRKARKGHWLQKRADRVQAKGKGVIQTYWVTLGSSKQEDADLSSGSFAKTQGRPFDEGQHARLIDWNVDLLSRLLKQIIAHRGRTRSVSLGSPNVGNVITSTPRNEITEAIKMPRYAARKKNRPLDLKTVELHPLVLQQLRELVTTISSLYAKHPFHNFEHACYVTLSSQRFLGRVVVSDDGYTYGINSDPLTQFAIIFASLVHDMDHSGVSNTQLVKEGNRLAKVYNKKSVAEQHSTDLAWELLTSPEFSDVFSTICSTEADSKRFRNLLVNSVIATDIFDKELVEFRNKRWKKAFYVESKTSSDASSDDAHDDDQLSLRASIVIEHIIQAADVAHTMQHWHVYRKWNERLFVEMYDAYKNGRGGDKDPSEGWYNGEMWFFDNYVIPLAKKLKDCQVFGVASDECLNYAMENRMEWEQKGKGIVKDLISKYYKLTSRGVDTIDLPEISENAGDDIV